MEDVLDKIERKLISNEWLVIDRTSSKKYNALCDRSKFSNGEKFNECDSLSKLSHSHASANLRPYVPFHVEELVFIKSLIVWSNCNVRVIGILRSIDDEFYIESIEELDSTHKLLLVITCLENLPNVNEIIQVFGQINLEKQNDCVKPFIKVYFLKNVEIGNLALYIKALDIMRPFIPLFINTNQVTVTNNNFDDSQYFHHHSRLIDNENDELCNDDDDDDFNYQY